MENPFIAAQVVPGLVRVGVRVMPKWLRTCRPLSNIGLWANARLLRQHFENTVVTLDGQAHWEAIAGAAAILESLSIPHLEESEDVNVWRAFLARIVAAADGADIKRARSVMDNEDDIRRAAEADEVKRNPDKGDVLVRFMMKRATSAQEVQTLYDRFKEQSPKTFEIEAFAAYSLKTLRLSEIDPKDKEMEEAFWWRFNREAEEMRHPEEAARAIEALEKEYPDD